MSTITNDPARAPMPCIRRRPAVGAVNFVGAMVAGHCRGSTPSRRSPATTWGDLAGYAGLVLSVAVLAVWLAAWARAGTPDRHAGVALGFAVAAVATFVGFWSGWPHIFAAVAVALALEPPPSSRGVLGGRPHGARPPSAASMAAATF